MKTLLPCPACGELMHIVMSTDTVNTRPVLICLAYSCDSEMMTKGETVDCDPDLVYKWLSEQHERKTDRQYRNGIML